MRKLSAVCSGASPKKDLRMDFRWNGPVLEDANGGGLPLVNLSEDTGHAVGEAKWGFGSPQEVPAACLAFRGQCPFSGSQ